jgi:hypothetical protein
LPLAIANSPDRADDSLHILRPISSLHAHKGVDVLSNVTCEMSSFVDGEVSKLRQQKLNGRILDSFLWQGCEVAIYLIEDWLVLSRMQGHHPERRRH